MRDSTVLLFGINLVPRIVSEPLFQSSSQKTTLSQEIVSVEVFETADIRFRMLNTLLFIAISFRYSMDGKTFCHTYLCTK